jgi:hypothetical protein
MLRLSTGIHRRRLKLRLCRRLALRLQQRTCRLRLWPVVAVGVAAEKKKIADE